jgi:hypothetical protein
MVIAMDNKDKIRSGILDIIDSLQPDGDDYHNNERFYHWLDYACELDELLFAVYDGKGKEFVTKRLTQLTEGSAQHDAITDVMLTIQENNYTLV